MTSKEALDMLRTTYILPADIKANYGEIIAKDLEVLDILKKYVLTADLLDNDTKVFRINALFMWDDAGYKEIKRWIEEK